MGSDVHWHTISARLGIALAIASIFAGPVADAQPTSIGSQKRVDANTHPICVETCAAASQQNPSIAVAAWIYEPYTLGAALTTDGGTTWIEPPINNLLGSNHFDPTATADHRTGTLWIGGCRSSGVGFVTPMGLWVAKWNGSTSAPAFDAQDVLGDVQYTDKPMMCIGPRPGQPTLSRMYMVYTGTFGGNTRPRLTWADYDDSTGTLGAWQTPPTLLQPAGGPTVSGPLVRIGPNGQVYIVFWDQGFGVWMHRVTSGDPPATFTNPIQVATRLDTWASGFAVLDRIPGYFRKPAWAYLAVDPIDGTLYSVYFDRTMRLCTLPPSICQHDIDIYMTKSPAQAGQTPGDPGTWTTPQIVNVADGVPYDQFFPWIEVDHAHRIHLVFYDTLGSSLNWDQVAVPQLRTRYAYSTNGGTSWTESTLAPAWINEPPPPATWPSDAGNDPFIGDYNGMAATTTRVYPVYMATLGPSNPTNPNRDIFTNVIVWP